MLFLGFLLGASFQDKPVELHKERKTEIEPKQQVIDRNDRRAENRYNPPDKPGY